MVRWAWRYHKTPNDRPEPFLGSILVCDFLQPEAAPFLRHRHECVTNTPILSEDAAGLAPLNPRASLAVANPNALCLIPEETSGQPGRMR